MEFFFFPARFVHISRRPEGSPGRVGGLSAVGPADGARGARGKGIWRQIPLTIGSSGRDKRRYDRSEDKKQMEPIIIKTTHRFLCTRRTKIRSKKDESEGTDPTTIQPSYYLHKMAIPCEQQDRRTEAGKTKNDHRKMGIFFFPLRGTSLEGPRLKGDGT